MVNNEIRILNDQPIDHETFFNFDDYSDALAGIILHEDTNTPLVIGIFGDWGSGKTSLMKTLKKKIENVKDGHSAQTIWFNAWKYDKEDVISRALLTRILQELETKGEKKDEKILNRRLKDLQRSLYKDVYREDPGSLTFDLGKASKGVLKLGLSTVPIIGEGLAKLFEKGVDKDAIIEIAESLHHEKIITNIEKIGELEQFQSTFREIIRDHYIQHNKRAVVFIDDLDRCVPDKAIEVMEAIKLFLDVEGCIFILGIDRNVIREGVRIKYKDFTLGGIKVPINGEEYLEKIIQLSFMLPPIMENKLKEFIDDLDQKKSYKEYHDMIINGIGRNPRKIKRFINAIRFQQNLAEIIPEMKDIVKEDIKQTFDALLIEWQIISSSSNSDFENFRKEVIKNPGLLIKSHDYVESLKSGKKDEPPKELNPFWNDSIKELIWVFPYPGTLKEGDTDIIKKVTHLSNVTETKTTIETGVEETWTLEKVKEAIKKGMSLEGKDLSGLSLNKMNLNGANLSGAKLIKTDLSEAKLVEANIVHTDLSGAILIGTDLSKASLAYAVLIRANLSEAILKNAKLPNADFSYAILNGANLTEAYLSLSDFSYSNLSKATLTGTLGGENKFIGANLSGADLSNADLTDAKLSDANLSGLDLTNVPLSGADLSNANLIKTKLPEDLTRTILTGADLTGAKLSGSTLYGDLSRIVLNNAELNDIKFTEIQTLSGAKIKGAKIGKSDLSGLDLSNVDFSNTDLIETNLNKTNLSKAILIDAKLFNAKLQHANLSNANLSNAKLSGSDFYYADLSNASLIGADISGTDLSYATLIKIKTTRIKVNENTNARDVILVMDEDPQDEAKIKRALDDIDKGLRDIIIKQNERYRNIYSGSEPASAIPGKAKK
ncbi:MAG: pentapeptide repeat-containing protein [Candidatus Methanoperedens sp.]|nr:pentapeptide repeat-containing protein [Candidatus Methanoperedens sp.]MCZ7371892.1 pentapeptide repeat-containing protein [Candidatus Methanoperedens sp.]